MGDFKLTVEGFPEAGSIPARFTCEGDNVAPALRWAGEPAGTQSYALIVDDPGAPGRKWNHWLLWDIPSSVHQLPEGQTDAGLAKCGINDFGRAGYGGPCPPKGDAAHRYYFRLFALDTPALGLPEGADRDALEKAVRKHALAETSYKGHYQRF